MIHHYGLQIFATILSNNQGYFNVVSSSKRCVNFDVETFSNSSLPKPQDSVHIPGTEYRVLIPMTINTEPLNPSFDADIQYQFDLRQKYRVCGFEIKGEYERLKMGQKGDWTNRQLRKEKMIDLLGGKLLEWMVIQEERQTGEVVLLLSAADWEKHTTEIFCKALMMCLIQWKPNSNQGFYVIIKDCRPNDFIAITRMFAIFYGKNALSKYMERLQVYLSGGDQSEEFLIAGSDMPSLLTMAGKLTLVRGIQPQCMGSIEYILKKFQMRGQEKDTIDLKLVPFDILEIPGMSGTLFEQAVKKVLESDIQKYSFGCKLSCTHMRIGSKLHIEEFYEAELLFHNNYYVARFANLLIRRLEPILEQNKPLMLVGYETYSELLLYEVLTNLRGKGYDSSYMIYEQRREGRFRYYDSADYFKMRSEVEIVMIVPINSSMTTHSKLRASLMMEVDRLKSDCVARITANYALILIRSAKEDMDCDDMEKRYCISMKEGKIKTRFLPQDEPDINYFVCVSTKWHHPLECKWCFPKDSMVKERPLIETNRASIIPVQMLGIHEPDIFGKREKKETQKEDQSVNLERVQRLSDCLIYKHIVRKDNHFLYYFELEKFFMQNREDIIEWLKGIKKRQKKREKTVYDVLVAPLHFSNAGFLAEVNYHLFGNAALVLNFEVEKEFRDNVKTKYSNIIGLYKKLLDMGKSAELRFHFLDDNIISGNTYFRAKSLFSSLLPEKEGGLVTVSVFADVIVLLNRMSVSSIRNCISDIDDYHAYVSLNISAMRHHEDACTLCKIVENATILRNQSATNVMYEYWDKKIVQHQVTEAEEFRNNTEKIYYNEERRKRAARRMLCTHITNERLDGLGYQKNDTRQVRKVMVALLEDRTEEGEAIEWIISYIKIFSRPFVSFRKSCREAAFGIMLELLEFMVTDLMDSLGRLRKKRFSSHGELKKVCSIIRDAKTEWGQDDKLYSLLLTLMKRLSELGSNYVIRDRNREKLYAVMESLNVSEEKKEDFNKKYLGIVKRIGCLSSDESKCIYLEYLLLFGEEFISEEAERESIRVGLRNCPMLKEEQKFMKILFLENTRVLLDGIRDLADEYRLGTKDDDLLLMIKEKYYYENFRRLLTYYQFMEGYTGEGFVRGKGEKILALVKLYLRLSDEIMLSQGRDVVAFYDELLQYVEVITGAEKVCLLFRYEISENEIHKKQKFYKKQSKKEIFLEELGYQVSEFLYDTYAQSKTNGSKVLIKYRNYVGKEYSAKEKNQMNDVYLELSFPTDIEEKRKLIALKFIMVFRSLIVENLERDFSNNLMQKWSAEQSFKKNMLLERATDHTDKDDLAEYLKLISTGLDEWNEEHRKALFQLVINSYIARINVQLLADALPEGENESYAFQKVYKEQLDPLIKALHDIEEFYILDENEEEQFSQTVLNARIRMYKDERRCERISIRRLSIIIMELILSAIRCSDDKRISIYRENGYLVVRNTFKSDKAIERIQQGLDDSSSRKKEGISLAVIKELINKFYLLDESSGVIIKADEIKNIKYFYVKLPILTD